MLYYYFQESVGKIAPDYEVSGEPSQPIGETLRPVWALMDKCYPVTTQKPKAKRGKKQASKAGTTRAPGLSGAVPKEESDILSQEERQENNNIQKEAVYPSEPPEVDSHEERTRTSVPAS
ncbi:uncharacterized protein LOC118757599 isoform X2 [Ochotona princeps]|nr:uncharacterized protein LOC118757599 isoform X2 [Ochotona princeps]